MRTFLTSIMRKDSRWRIMLELGGELSLKHILETKSMKKALHRFLNWECWLTEILHNTKKFRFRRILNPTEVLDTIVCVFIQFDQPQVLRRAHLEFLINFLSAEGTQHSSWTQPLFYTDQAVDVLTGQADRIPGVAQTNWANAKTKPALKNYKKVNIVDRSLSFVEPRSKITILPENMANSRVFARP